MTKQPCQKGPVIKKGKFAVLLGSLLLMLILFSALASNEDANRSPLNPADEINPENLKNSVTALQALGSRTNHAGQQSAADFIRQTLRSLGLKPDVRQYPHAGKVWENITVSFPGDLNPNQSILVVSHFDSKAWSPAKQAPGADDNASGIAVLLELARILREKSHQSSVRLVFFSNEETGRAGSKSFARRARQAKTEILAVLNIDGVGYTPKPLEIIRDGAVLFNSGISPVKRGKILAVQLKNFVTQPFRGRRILKLVTREEDRRLIEGYSGKPGLWEKTAILIENES
ncbi:MAG: M20/M25/M40 family metallo-hydrolase [Desulfurivibrionaceae bacterium]